MDLNTGDTIWMYWLSWDGKLKCQQKIVSDDLATESADISVDNDIFKGVMVLTDHRDDEYAASKFIEYEHDMIFREKKMIQRRYSTIENLGTIHGSEDSSVSLFTNQK